MDKFRFFASPIAQALTVEIPDTGSRDARKVTLQALRLKGLSMPSDTVTFWVNSRRCILTRGLDGSPLGELLEVIE